MLARGRVVHVLVSSITAPTQLLVQHWLESLSKASRSSASLVFQHPMTWFHRLERCVCFQVVEGTTANGRCTIRVRAHPLPAVLASILHDNAGQLQAAVQGNSRQQQQQSQDCQDQPAEAQANGGSQESVAEVGLLHSCCFCDGCCTRCKQPEPLRNAVPAALLMLPCVHIPRKVWTDGLPPKRQMSTCPCLLSPLYVS